MKWRLKPVIVIYHAGEIGGGCRISGDSVVMCLGLRVLFLRAAVGLWRTELLALRAELCWFRMDGLLLSESLCVLSFKTGLQTSSPFHRELGGKSGWVIAVIRGCLIWYHPQLLPSPSCAPARGAFGSLGGALLVAPLPSPGTPGEKLPCSWQGWARDSQNHFPVSTVFWKDNFLLTVNNINPITWLVHKGPVNNLGSSLRLECIKY